MDVKNPFETPTTFRLHRAEYLAAFALSNVLIVWHWGDIRWWAWIGLFAYIDVIGYFPGAIAFRRSPDGRIPRGYYLLYNFMHSLITQGTVVLLWGFLVRWEWALLAIPWHVMGDRGVFGNFMKTFSLPFEPHETPGYRKLIDSLGSAVGGGTATSGDEPRLAARTGQAR
jgi:hypothetical protein